MRATSLISSIFDSTENGRDQVRVVDALGCAFDFTVHGDRRSSTARSADSFRQTLTDGKIHVASRGRFGTGFACTIVVEGIAHRGE
jgi:hypothetical protein